MALEQDSGDGFARLGVRFQLITPDMMARVEDFMWTNFFPNAPVARSLGLTTRSWLANTIIIRDKGLCSARGHGIRGLGTELVRRWLT